MRHRTTRAYDAPVRDRLLRDGYWILAIAFVLLRLFAVEPWDDSVDAYAYWTTGAGHYYDAAQTGVIGAYLYSPAFAQLVQPFTFVSWHVFVAAWTALNFALLWWMLGRLALPALLFLPVSFEIISGNVHLLIAACIVAGFRWSAVWALPILTKVTPGHRRCCGSCCVASGGRWRSRWVRHSPSRPCRSCSIPVRGGSGSSC